MSILESVKRIILLVVVVVASIAIASTLASAAVQSVTDHELGNFWNDEIQAGPAGDILSGLVAIEVETVPANAQQIVEDWNDNGAASRLQGDLDPNAADFNASGSTDGADFLTWQHGFGIAAGAGRADGDATGNGAVDFVDRQLWEVLYGSNGDGFGNGTPTSTLTYELGGAFDISEIITYSNWGDARTFQTFVVNFSTDNGSNFTQLGFFQSDPNGDRDTPNGGNPFLDSTKVTISDDGGGLLGTGVTDIQFEIFAGSIVTATGSPFTPFVNDLAADPYDGVNDYTGLDDGLPAATQGTAWQEIDVFGVLTPDAVSSITGVPEPSSLVGLLIGTLLGLGRFCRKKTTA